MQRICDGSWLAEEDMARLFAGVFRDGKPPGLKAGGAIVASRMQGIDAISR
jgi:hypothetical protein